MCDEACYCVRTFGVTQPQCLSLPECENASTGSAGGSTSPTTCSDSCCGGLPTTTAPEYDASEQDEIIATFSQMLRAATKDGGRKRAAGTKPSWKVDLSHEAAIYSHLAKWKRNELVDPDSGAHPLIHAAWRCLAIAHQETN